MSNYLSEAVTFKKFLPNKKYTRLFKMGRTSSKLYAFHLTRPLISYIKKEGYLDIESSGFYLLLGESEYEGGMFPEAYIGVGNCLNRFRDHNADKSKEFWNTAIAFYLEGEALDKGQVEYLEQRFYDLAKKSGKYKLNNNSRPKGSPVSHYDKIELDHIFEEAILMVESMNYDVFSCIEQSKHEGEVLFLRGKQIEAKGEYTPEAKMLVYSGSGVVPDEKANFHASNFKSYLPLREKLVQEGIISHNVETGTMYFTQDYLFSSPSAAASVIYGNGMNGKTSWKNEEGKTLAELY